MVSDSLVGRATDSGLINISVYWRSLRSALSVLPCPIGLTRHWRSIEEVKLTCSILGTPPFGSFSDSCPWISLTLIALAPFDIVEELCHSQICLLGIIYNSSSRLNRFFLLQNDVPILVFFPLQLLHFALGSLSLHAATCLGSQSLRAVPK